MDTTSVTPTRKRKRLSKNKKKNWRKTDVDDVEEFLEDQRLQERTGGLVSEKADTSLFFVDKSKEIKKDQSVPKRRKAVKPLRCHAQLEPDPNIKPARVPRNPRKEPQHKKVKVIERHVLQLRSSLKQDDSEPLYVQKDLWTDVKKDPDMDEYYLRQTKKKLPEPPPHLSKKPSELPAVEVPHPGASYNPLYEEYQDLLKEAHEIEVKKEKEELKIKRAIDEMIPKISVQCIKDRWMQEMSAGINDADLSDDGKESLAGEGSTNHDDVRLSINPPVRRENKKTRSQRHKERERRAKEKLAAMQKANITRKQELFRLRRIKLEVQQKLLALKKRQELRAAKKQAEINKPKKLGKLKYQEPYLEIKLCDELPDSLRHLKPEGHLLEDRMKSLQRRNVIEPRQKVKRKHRYKRKTYVKKSHKQAVELIKKACT